MVKNWSKIVLVSMLVVVLGASMAFGSTSRVRSLANTGDYLSDDSNIFRWYSTLPSYANMVQAELGYWLGGYSPLMTAPADNAGVDSGALLNTRGLSFNYACGEDGKYGTYRVTLLENAVDDPSFHIVNPFMMLTPGMVADLRDPFDYTPLNKWDVAGGWDINENIAVGASVTRSSWKYKTETADVSAGGTNYEGDGSFTTIGVGGSWSNNEDLVFDAAFSIGFAGGKTDIITDPATNGGSVEFDKGTAIDFAARGFWDWKDWVTVVPVVEYGMAEYSLKSNFDENQPGTDPLPLPNGDKVNGFMGGVGLDLDVNSGNTLIFAVEFSQFHWEYANPDTFQNEYKVRYLPTMRLALETEITSWLTTRIGAVHHNVKVTDTNGDGKDVEFTNGAHIPPSWSSFYESGFDWWLGCGFNVAEWVIDLELAPETPFSLGYWLTGYSAWDALDGGYYGPVSRISGTYNF